MTTFLLIRHGEHIVQNRVLVGRAPGVHLSDMGQQQAQLVAELLKSDAPTALFSSPQDRAQETAGFAARLLGLPVQVSESLSEFDFGEWTGKTLWAAERDPRWDDFNRYRSGTRAPGGEMMLEVQARVVAQIAQWHQEYPEGSLALFTHGDVIRAAIMHYLGIPLDLFLRLEISLASVTTLVLHDYGPEILCINDTGHLR